jgi:hypothetical protein
MDRGRLLKKLPEQTDVVRLSEALKNVVRTSRPPVITINNALTDE